MAKCCWLFYFESLNLKNKIYQVKIELFFIFQGCKSHKQFFFALRKFILQTHSSGRDLKKINLLQILDKYSYFNDQYFCIKKIYIKFSILFLWFQKSMLIHFFCITNPCFAWKTQVKVKLHSNFFFLISISS